MKHLSSTSWLLSAIVLLCGCGGYQGGGYPGSTGGGAGGVTLPPPSSGPNVAGNWQFSTTSTAGMPSATIAGGINQSGSSVSGAVHVEGSKCFDRLTTIALTGTLTGSDISLTSTSVGGQVLTLTGSISGIGNAFTGTYTINGGCANGEQGTVTGRAVGVVRGSLSGTFTTSGGETFDMGGYINPGYAGFESASPEGSFGISGTANFGTSCFGSGTIVAGTFPSGSFMIGTSVVLAIQTDNGTFIFVGTDTDHGGIGAISGEYTVTGGTCDQTGTALLHADPWGY
jgi:hypothetical protein